MITYRTRLPVDDRPQDPAAKGSPSALESERDGRRGDAEKKRSNEAPRPTIPGARAIALSPPESSVFDCVHPVPSVTPGRNGLSGDVSRAYVGGAETRVVERIQGAVASGALFTSRGPSREHGVASKRVNEDGLVLGVARGPAREVFFAAVADPGDYGGGAGHEVGIAAARALAPIHWAAARVAAGGFAEGVMKDWVAEACASVRAAALCSTTGHLSTTLSGVFVRGGEAHVIHVGDSGIAHFSGTGALKNRTRPHTLHEERAESSGDPNIGLEWASVRTRSIGGVLQPEAVYEQWALDPGDVLVVASDGLYNANLLAQRHAAQTAPWDETGTERTLREIGNRLGNVALSSGDFCENAVTLLRQYALVNMVARQGAPDNFSIGVVRCG